MWLIYALGGGWGHLTRAIALARIAERDRPVRILTNSPYADIARPAFSRLTGGTACPTTAAEREQAGQGVRHTESPQAVKDLSCCDTRNALDIVAFDAGATADQTRAAVTREIAESRPSCLIVDTFPRGIGGELAGVLGNLAARKVLVQRELNSRYVEAARLREFVAAHYDLVLAPGAGEGSQLGGPAPAHETHPWLVRCAGEIPDRAQARYVLVCASGKPEELQWYGEVISELRKLDCPVPVRCVAADRPPECPLECWVRYWPAMELLGAAAVVVGGAGYNTIEECLACGVPLIARPWPRIYDRQDLRAQRASARGRVLVVNEPQEAARQALKEIGNRTVRPLDFANGVTEAVTLIGKLRWP
ncbi:MAG TPA: glycosyltransferase [Bryobacteraceae bacterium]|nr:glycosyltransferase [Bryobacteraceae bacterium]